MKIKNSDILEKKIVTLLFLHEIYKEIIKYF